MKHPFFWLVSALLLSLVACGKTPPASPASVVGDPHAAEQAAMEKSTMDFSNLLIVRLQRNGQRLEVTSVLPAQVAEATVSGQSAKTIFRINEKGDGLLLFSRDLLNGRSFRTELSLADLEQKKGFSFPVVQGNGSLKEQTFSLERMIRQP